MRRNVVLSFRLDKKIIVGLLVMVWNRTERYCVYKLFACTFSVYTRICRAKKCGSSAFEGVSSESDDLT